MTSTKFRGSRDGGGGGDPPDKKPPSPSKLMSQTAEEDAEAGTLAEALVSLIRVIRRIIFGQNGHPPQATSAPVPAPAPAPAPVPQAWRYFPRRRSLPRHYAVTVGLEVGYFSDWHKVSAVTQGVPGSSYRRYDSKAEAEEAYALAEGRGEVYIVPQ